MFIQQPNPDDEFERALRAVVITMGLACALVFVLRLFVELG